MDHARHERVRRTRTCTRGFEKVSGTRAGKVEGPGAQDPLGADPFSPWTLDKRWIVRGVS